MFLLLAANRILNSARVLGSSKLSDIISYIDTELIEVRKLNQMNHFTENVIIHLKWKRGEGIRGDLRNEKQEF